MRLLRCIAEAAKELDDTDPTWYTRIDLDKLDMHSYSYCILGQLCGHYNRHPFVIDKRTLCNDSVFGFQADPSLWEDEILKRRERSTDRCDMVITFNQAAERVDCLCREDVNTLVELLKGMGLSHAVSIEVSPVESWEKLC